MTVHRQWLLFSWLSLSVGACEETAPLDGTLLDADPLDASTNADAGAVTASDAGSVDADVKVGEFSLQLVAAVGDTPGFTALLGKVYDGPATADIVWQARAELDGCVLNTPRVPFCDPGCGSAVCIDDDVCRASPTALSAGTLTVTGVRTASGQTEFSVAPIKNTYQSPSGGSLPYPAFAEGAAITLRAAGAELPAFTLTGSGIAPLVLTSGDSYPIADGKPLALSWTPPAAPGGSRISVHLDISHHGGAKGQIDCDVDDDGAFSIPASLVDQLVDLGVAGFPTVLVSRVSRSSSMTARGRVDLRIYASVERAVTLPNLISCGADEDCPSGLRCQSDKTCH